MLQRPRPTQTRLGPPGHCPSQGTIVFLKQHVTTFLGLVYLLALDSSSSHDERQEVFRGRMSPLVRRMLEQVFRFRSEIAWGRCNDLGNGGEERCTVRSLAWPSESTCVADIPEVVNRLASGYNGVPLISKRIQRLSQSLCRRFRGIPGERDLDDSRRALNGLGRRGRWVHGFDWLLLKSDFKGDPETVIETSIGFIDLPASRL